MVRAFIIAFVWLCGTAWGWAQAQPVRQPTSTPAERSTVKQPSPILSTGNGGSCELGVISSVGDEFQVQKVGFFSVAENDVPIGNWGLDDLAFERVRVAAGPGTTVRRIPYTKEAFPPPKPPPFTLFRDMRAELVDLMRQVTRGTNCRRYVLVSKSISAFRGMSQPVRGIGITDWDSPLRHQTYLYALGFIRVFDGHDFRIVRQGSAMIEREPLLNRLLLGPTVIGPYRELDASAFPSNPADAAQNPAFRDRVRDMLRVSLDRTLPFMLRPPTDEISR